MSPPPLPAQPSGAPWPTQTWPLGALPPPAARALEAQADWAFSPAGERAVGATDALLVIQEGRLAFERYAQSLDASTRHHSWSMAKSIVHALCGLVVGEGRLDVLAPAQAPEWTSAHDPRQAITVEALLRMSSGLRFNESYQPDQGSDVIEMLYGRGRDDVAGFAAAFPLDHPPGAVFSYSSGSTNIVSRLLAHRLEANASAFRAFMVERLFNPLGMTSADPKFDAAGTFIGSSFCPCSAQDFARFGLLYLRDGIWNGRRLLPEGWVDHARSATPQPQGCPDGPYGAHWWLEVGGPGSFAAVGYEGQFLIVEPAIDAIIVRHGRSPLELKEPLARFMKTLAQTLR